MITRNVHLIWALMLGLTLLTFIIGHYEKSGVYFMLFLLFTAAIKSYFIIHEYMGLRGVSRLWQMIMYGWLTIVMLGISIPYLISFF